MITLKNSQRTGLFDLLGRLWYLADQEKSNYTTRQTTLSNLASALTHGAALPSGSQAAFRYQMENLLSADSGLTRIVLQLTRDLVKRAVAADVGRPVSEAESAELIIKQMRSAGYYVTAPTISISTTGATGNGGDAQLIAGTMAPDGNPVPTWIAESGEVRFESNPIAKSREAVPLDSVLWPQGTGYQDEAVRLASLDENLLVNGDLSVASGLVTNWIARGTQWQAILPPQDKIAFSAKPSGGSFRLSFTNRNGEKRSTPDLLYSATATDLAQALAALDAETAAVQVSATGDGLGFILDWPRGRYELPLLEIEASLVGATASVTRTRQGTAGGYAGPALRFVGNNSELTGIYQRFQYSAPAVAILVVRVWHDGATSGTLQIGLVNGPTSASTPINRPNGTANAFNTSIASLAANQFHVLTCPLAWNATVDGYVTIRLTAPLSTGKTLAVNRPQLLILPSQTIVRPGLLLLANRFGPSPGDSWTWTVSNNYAGKVGLFWLRAFADPTLALPRSGTTLIPESIISA